MTFLAILGVILLIVASVVYGSLAWGLVLYKFWGWFVLFAFPTAPAITFAMAVGLFCVIQLFNLNTTQFKSETKDTKATLIVSFLSPWVMLFTGWVIHLIIG